MSFEHYRSKDSRKLADRIDVLAREGIGAAIEVHRVLGLGLPEVIDRNALSRELSLRCIDHVIECPVPVEYEGVAVGKGRVDLLVRGMLVIDLKAVDQLVPMHRDQVIAYLSAMRLEPGSLINFNLSILADGVERVVRSKD
jgi:GxxExxY protein